jgi:hypothetical protein
MRSANVADISQRRMDHLSAVSEVAVPLSDVCCGSNREELSASMHFPLCPRTRTFIMAVGKLLMGHQWNNPSLLDHLIGPSLERGRYVQVKRSGCCEIDDHLEGRRLYHRKIDRLLALEDAARIQAGLAIGTD